jgi:putative transcriptional regulator
MDAGRIVKLRASLRMSQVEFGQLLGVHFMTVSKWERGVASPSPYQVALMEQFDRAAKAKDSVDTDELKNLLIGVGVAAALLLILNAASKG